MDSDGDGKGDVCDNNPLGGPGTQNLIANPGVAGSAAQLSLFPNPFIKDLRIRLYLPEAGLATLQIFNLHGQLVKRLYHGQLGPGKYNQHWDGMDLSGRQMPSGMYFVQLRFGDELINKHVVLQ